MVFQQYPIPTMLMYNNVTARLRLTVLKKEKRLRKSDFIIFLYIGELIESESKRDIFESAE